MKMRNLVDKAGEVHQAFLGHLNDAQAARVILIEDCLDGGGFARAAIAVEQAVVRRQADQERNGVVDGGAPLQLVALEIAERRRIGMLHGMDCVISPDEGAVARVHAAAVVAVILLEPIRKAALAAQLLDRLSRAPGRQGKGVGSLGRVREKVLRRQRAELQNDPQIASRGASHGGGDGLAARRGQGEGVFVIQGRLRQTARQVFLVAALAQSREKLAPGAQKRLRVGSPQQPVERTGNRPV